MKLLLSNFTIASIVFSIFLLTACNNAVEKVDKKTAQDTRELVRIAHEKIGPKNITYTLNLERAAIYKKQADAAVGINKLNYLIQYSIEMLNGGDTKEAIETLNYVIESARLSNIPLNNDMGIMLQSALAISYMRQGEQENCIKNHNHQSCIVPISEDGIHQLKEGSTKAIEIFEDILAIKPDHEQSRWLLNLAHMTLGTYPDAVPKNFLLNPSYFEQNLGEIPVFENIASQLGIDDNRLSGATIADDFDNDGDIDIIASSWGLNDNIKYYVNHQGSFHDMTSEMGLEGIVGGLNIKQTDYNNDGFLDVYLMRGAWMRWDGRIPNTLLKNNGDGSFTDVTIQAGILKPTPTQASSWNDFNLDGWLDLIVVNESFDTLKFPTQLWMNNQDGTFTDVAKGANLTETGYFKGISVNDLNNDGWPDIYVSALDGPNLMYLHRGLGPDGLPKFTEMAAMAEVTGPVSSFPNAIFDFNNDGLNDILVSNYQSRMDNPAADLSMNAQGKFTDGMSHLYINEGNGKFQDISADIGLTEAIYTMGCNYGDIDNDGWIDFYLATGDPSFFSIVPNKMFKNNGGQGILDVTFAGGFGHIQKGHGVSMADLDSDGNLDVYVVMGGAYQGDNFQNAFFHNPGNDNHWVSFQLEGVVSNKKAIDARLKIVIEENGVLRNIYKTVNSGASFGANSLDVLVGIGKATRIDRVEIQWPNKARSLQILKNFELDSNYKIVEGQDEPIKLQKEKLKLDVSHQHNHGQHI